MTRRRSSGIVPILWGIVIFTALAMISPWLALAFGAWLAWKALRT